LANFLNNLHSN